jgi:hypothetical protein
VACPVELVPELVPLASALIDQHASRERDQAIAQALGAFFQQPHDVLNAECKDA